MVEHSSVDRAESPESAYFTITCPDCGAARRSESPRCQTRQRLVRILLASVQREAKSSDGRS